MRDNFTARTTALLGKRVGYKCSIPHCRQTTSGPQEEPDGTVNIGVAAHITAASSGGPRYDPDLTAEQRKSAENGIWLCPKCSKLIDSDLFLYTVKRLRSWKAEAEELARIELETGVEDATTINRLVRIERLAPDLIKEMRADMDSSPLLREFVLLRRGWIYNPGAENLRYYYEDHENLDSLVQIMENLELVWDVSPGDIKKYRISEELADFLTPD